LPVVLPAIEVKTLQGQPTRLQTFTSGKVALISFWAPWCEACTTEFDALDRLQADAERRGAIVVAVAVGEPLAKVAEYVDARKPKYPQLVDEQFALADALGQRRVPSTVVIDREGRVTYAGGALDRDALAALRSALDAPQTRPAGEGDIAPERVIEVSALPARVRAGEPGELNVRLRIAPGYHVMSNHPSAPQYIATKVVLAPSAALSWDAPQFPPAQTARVSDDEISTFAGELTVLVPFRVAPAAAPGVFPVEGEVGYQACTDGSCLFPTSKRFTVDVAVEP
jgi:peroxiredoxin